MGKMSLKDSVATRPSPPTEERCTPRLLVLHQKSTGLLLVPSPESRTKDLADHAGPSPPLEPWKVPTRSPLEPSSPSPSKSSSTATTTAQMAATVDPWKVLSNGTRPTRPSSSPTMATLQRTAPAWSPPTPESSTPRATRPSLPTPLMLTRWPSNTTPVVSSIAPHAEPTLTTVSLPSATVLTTELLTGSSRTPGEAAGVTMATSRSPWSTVPVSAESRWPPSTQSSELSKFEFLSQTLRFVTSNDSC